MQLPLLGYLGDKKRQGKEDLQNVNCDLSSMNLDDMRERLKQIKRQRAAIAKKRRECECLYETSLAQRVNRLNLLRQSEVEAYQSVVLKRQSLAHWLDLSSRWNVVNDCFHIWHSGPWATINGARLGGEAPRLPAGLLVPELHSQSFSTQRAQQNSHYQQQQSHTNDSQKKDTQQPGRPAPRRYLLWSSATAPAPLDYDNNNYNNGSNNSSTHNSKHTSSSSSSANSPSNYAHSDASTTIPQAPTIAPKVPWPEINAALGHACLLLLVLRDRSGWTLPHELMPMASTSQIGVRRGRPNIKASAATSLPAPVVYNLYFEESGFSLFKGGALRNFNIALVAFAECLDHAATELLDKTIAMPHSIQVNGDDPFATTIGGCLLAYNENTAVDFTRACKYLLTNLKWLVAYTVKHHLER